MKNYLILVTVLVLSLSYSNVSLAGDFDWLRNLNIEATADPSGFRVRLASRFNIGDTQVSAVLNRVDSEADAYMVLRLGELSHRPVDEVVSVYRSSKYQGWGKMAKELGIKPGSREFHALKKGHDLGSGGKGQPSRKSKNKGKGKKNKHKNKGKGGKWSVV